ncbi:ComEA family DNA-binding protein [Sphingobacterium spiritivorum]|uniref:ComEA family DNA-binding protein n=1 Tax=Sphingobacterium spiritivorum TaxID=258 RepID=UPI003DA3AE75
MVYDPIRIVITGLLLSLSFCVAAQEKLEQLEEELIEQLNEVTDDFADISEYTERLRYFLRNPIDLNKTDGRDLSELLFLTPVQIANLLDHRMRSRRMLSVLELQGIEGFDEITIERLLPFVKVGDAPVFESFTLNKLWNTSSHEYMVRFGRGLQQARGYQITDTSRSRYLGNQDRYMVRYRLNYKDAVRLSINMEKDAGEPLFKYAQAYGFDFYSGSLSVKVNNRLKEVIMGDYSLQFGQGLVVWNGLAFGKGSWVSSVARQGIGLKPYTSFNETNFFRGLAGTIAMGRLQITPFMSLKKRSGHVLETDSGSIILSLSNSGLHRTPTEQRQRHSIDEYVYGGNVNYRIDRLYVGINLMHTNYSGYINPAELLRNRFAFRGQTLTNISGYYQYTFKNTYVFGEIAKSAGGGTAVLNGMVSSLHPKFSLVLLQRNYQKNYHQFFAQGIGEGGTVNNESGLYAGAVYHPSRKIEWVGYADVFRFPWLRFRADAPTKGYEVFSQITYQWYKKGRLALRFRHRFREENSSDFGIAEQILAELKRYQLRCDFEYKLTNQWMIRSRTEVVRYTKEFDAPQKGWLGAQDIFWSSVNKRISANLRIAYFNTDGFNSRIYTYENDVLYSSSFPSYFDKGYRTYANGRWRVRKNIDLWVKYAVTLYPDKDVIGSGLEQIAGNRKSDIKIQGRIQF